MFAVQVISRRVAREQAGGKSDRLNVIRTDGSVVPANQVGQVEDAVARQIPNKPYYFVGLNAGTRRTHRTRCDSPRQSPPASSISSAIHPRRDAKALSRIELDAARGGDVENPVELVLDFSRNEDQTLQWNSNLPLPGEFVQEFRNNRQLIAVLERLIGRGQGMEMRALFRTGQDNELYGLPRALREDTMRIAER